MKNQQLCYEGMQFKQLMVVHNNYHYTVEPLIKERDNLLTKDPP